MSDMPQLVAAMRKVCLGSKAPLAHHRDKLKRATTYLTNQISALSPRSGRWRKAWGVSPRDRGARSLSLRSGRKPFQRNCSLLCYRPLRGLGVCWASPPGAYAPGFTPASASRTQARLLIRQVCDYPLKLIGQRKSAAECLLAKLKLQCQHNSILRSD